VTVSSATPSIVPGVWPDPADYRELSNILFVYCAIHRTLDEQVARFEEAGSLSFPVLRDLTGEASDKGPLWWLKDHSHIFLRSAGSPVSAQLLDWGIGYAFHEVMKLVEATHQHRHYLPAFQGLADILSVRGRADITGVSARISRELDEDMARGVRRIRRLLGSLRMFFLRAYAGQRDNTHLARFLYDQEELVRSVFQADYDRLLAALYGEATEKLASGAARALLDGGYCERAEAALHKAAAMAPASAEIRELFEQVQNAAGRARQNSNDA
jgi:hypothetical protein